ncbi:hypothetical protein ACODT3_08790 [Streptomyces sp. 4.24]|uniref:hypothetical protein n=1 Tax=Streptomyces tritrimontium TaxID=3406573 RepID=UPI003BB56C23
MNAAADAAPAELTAAERVRSVLARAVSLSLTTEGGSCDLIGLHSVDRRGRISLHPPVDGPLAARVAVAPRGSLAALLEFTDVAATAVRERVRSRVTISGWLAPAGEPLDGGRLRLDTARVTLRTAAAACAVDVGLDEIALAEPDPLAVEEAALLTHLAAAHEDMVRGLVILAGSHVPPASCAPPRSPWTATASPCAANTAWATATCASGSRPRPAARPRPASRSAGSWRLPGGVCTGSDPRSRPVRASRAATEAGSEEIRLG